MANLVYDQQPEVVDVEGGDVACAFYYLGWLDTFFQTTGYDKKIEALVNDLGKCFKDNIPLQALFLSGIGSPSDSPYTPFDEALKAQSLKDSDSFYDVSNNVAEF